MTNSEFKAWFDGFTEAMDGIPNNKQWDRIKSRVKEIDGNAYAANPCAMQCAMQANVYNGLARIQGYNGIGRAEAGLSSIGSAQGVAIKGR